MQVAATKQMTNVDLIRGAIAAKIDSAAFSSWIAPLDFEISNNVLTLGAQNQFSADYISSVYENVLSSVADSFGLSLNICVHGAAKTPVANDNCVQSYVPMPASTNMAAFDAFVESDENAFVISACKKIAAGSVSFSPLFIYGPSGAGKTLLAECIRNASNGHVVMMTGGGFVAEFTRSLRDHNIFAFKDFCRNCDTFILDDVNALAGKRATMDEFLQLLIDLRNSGKNIVLTSNTTPNNLTGFDRRAQSLLASGLVADVIGPSDNVKRIMLMRGGVAANVASALSNRITGDGHMVTGVATKIKAYSELMNTDVTLDIAERLLADTLRKSQTPLAMVKSMCATLGVSYDAVCGTGRNRSLVLARQVMMAVLHRATKLSLAEIGNYVGGRDHATVMYALKQVEKLVKTDLVLSAQINDMIAEYK
ncbi:MAG: AAA family ATPase [Alphaproteobacteria bacterium]|nr:AAA family ATPase [Alphaproteobacteria bacterium]